MSNSKVQSNGISIGMILFLIFLTLKLANVGAVATWSWWWVTAPLWIPFVALVITVVILFVIALIATLWQND